MVDGLEEMFREVIETREGLRCRKCGRELDPEDGPSGICLDCKEPGNTTEDADDD